MSEQQIIKDLVSYLSNIRITPTSYLVYDELNIYEEYWRVFSTKDKAHDYIQYWQSHDNNAIINIKEIPMDGDLPDMSNDNSPNTSSYDSDTSSDNDSSDNDSSDNDSETTSDNSSDNSSENTSHDEAINIL
jgi:hypothetical protein